MAKEVMTVEDLMMRGGAQALWFDFWEWLKKWLEEHGMPGLFKMPTPHDIKEAYAFLEKTSEDADESKRFMTALSHKDLAKAADELAKQVEEAGPEPTILVLIAAGLIIVDYIIENW